MSFMSMSRRRRDFTTSAIAGFVEALPAASYDLRLLADLDDGRKAIALRTVPAAEMTSAATVAWLKAQSAAGVNVYARPLSTRHLLLDDLDGLALAELEAAEVVAAAIVETSRNNHQAWVTISEADIDADLAFHAARDLAQRFGGDIGAANRSQIGRLPGFTNNKRSRLDELTGKRPWVSLRYGRPMVTPTAPEILLRARLAVDAALKEKFAGAPAPNSPGPTRPIANPGAIYEIERSSWLSRHGVLDRSALDFYVAAKLVEIGYDDGTIATVLVHSEKAGERSAASGERYVDITIANARRRAESSRKATR